MQDFVKLFRAEDVGQVLVMKDSDDEGPNVTISFQAKDIGMAALKLGFKDTDEGWAKRDRAFELFTEDQALDAARKNAAMFA